jgi:hypothetical protein
VIEENYTFLHFENGILHNAAGENFLVNCSLREQNLSAATLSCFGAYYQEDVLGILMEQSKNIHFKTGWDCILWRSFRIEENYLIMMNDI